MTIGVEVGTILCLQVRLGSAGYAVGVHGCECCCIGCAGIYIGDVRRHIACDVAVIPRHAGTRAGAGAPVPCLADIAMRGVHLHVAVGREAGIDRAVGAFIADGGAAGGGDGVGRAEIEALHFLRGEGGVVKAHFIHDAVDDLRVAGGISNSHVGTVCTARSACDARMIRAVNIDVRVVGRRHDGGDVHPLVQRDGVAAAGAAAVVNA